jgi:hypothetical protein
MAQAFNRTVKLTRIPMKLLSFTTGIFGYLNYYWWIQIDIDQQRELERKKQRLNMVRFRKHF